MKWMLIALLFVGCVYVSEAKMPAVGDAAPAFAGTKDDGYTLSLGDYAGQWLALYFYPKADTPGCTKQACSLRDGIADLADLEIRVLGVSMDTVEAQAAFKAKYDLPFPLLADEDGEVAKLYGVKGSLLPFAKRVTFLINPEGQVADIIEDVSVGEHAQQIRESLEKLQGSEEP